ncbi:MAG TPA: HD domain-containing phosphohydrolase [Gaiellaceae bacterium]|nr:HD domain-containing phosphohydrolase [Gaiellaceae bacterium]
MAGRSVPLLALAAFAAIVPVAVLHFVGSEQVLFGGWVHFGGVAVGAGVATLCAVVLTIAGARQRDGYAVLVGSAFSVMAALLCLHGLATPGVFVDEVGVAAFTGGATLPIGGAILALGALSALRRPAAVRPLLWLLAAGVVFIFGLGIAAIVQPGLVPSVPEPRSTAAWIVLAAGLAFYAVLFWRAIRTYRLTQRGADLLVAVGIVWLAAALPAALLLDFRDLGWWLGHGFEIVGIAAVGFTVAHDLRRGAARSRPLLGDLGGADLVVEAESFLGSHIRALLAELAEKDAYTEEHTRRVALRAAQVGDELGLSPGRLRDLAIGGLLHDIGKLVVPDSILKKPAALTDEEYHVVMQHVYTGESLLKELGGFSPLVLRLVRGHHERFDGSGYPRAVAGDPIPLDVAILAVCDVYDALISERVYREAWTHERALEHLRAGAGKLFDASCVEALADVLARERRSELAVAV